MMNGAISTDFEPQADLLLTLYNWAADAVDAVARVYGEESPATLSPRPRRGEDASFRVTVGSSHGITFVLIRNRASGHPGWRVRAVTTSAEGAPVVLAPKRNASTWTRRGLEDALLGLLTSYERCRASGHEPSVGKRHVLA